METGVLISIALPLALFCIMLGMGISLVPQDFKRIVSEPKAAIVGLSAQMLLLPLLAFAVVSFFDIDPLLAVGLMILSFCPGGTTSNMMTFLVKGDLALSITLTAVVSLIAPFTIPFLTNISMDYLLGEATQFELPLLQTIITLVVITVLPIGIGMILRQWRPALCDQLESTVKVVSLAFMFLIIALVLAKNASNLPVYLQQVGLPVIVLSGLAIILGFAIAVLLKLNREQSITISFEVGMQNATTAMLITSTILGDDMMTVAPAVYGLIMFFVAGVFGLSVSAFFRK